MPPNRVVFDRCAVCDGALRAAARSVVRGVPLVHCASCGHCQVEREPNPVADVLDDTSGTRVSRWNAFEKAARRLLALRALGIDGGRLLDVGDGSAFAHVASAGPFDVTSVGMREHADVSPRGLLATLRSLELPPSTFRVATVWSGLALESDPVGLLEHLRRVLTPGGVLALAVHVEDDPAAVRRVPRGADPLTAARHVFSRTSLRAAVLRSGFDVTSLVPADLQPTMEGLRIHEQLVARASLSLLGTLARERRYAVRFMPEVLWHMANTAELWAKRPSDPR